MAEQLDPSEIVDLRELLMSGVIQSEALINLLDRKGIITKQELLEEMKKIQATLPKNGRAENSVSKNRDRDITSNKPRPALTEEDAQNIVNDYMEQQKPRRGIYSITDSVPGNCNAYALPQKDCWYVLCSAHPSQVHMICSSRIIAISKATGEVIYDGDACDEG